MNYILNLYVTNTHKIHNNGALVVEWLTSLPTMQGVWGSIPGSGTIYGGQVTKITAYHARGLGFDPRLWVG